MKWTSDQGVFNALLPEYVSLLGMSVKTLHDLDFPGGFHYHRSKDFIKNIVEGKVEPVTFHMHWTKTALDKINFMKQMGMWYIENKCMGNTKSIDLTISSCCSIKPLVDCFYFDKGSVPFCRNQQNMTSFDNNNYFWS